MTPEASRRQAPDGYPGRPRHPAHDDMYAFTPSFQNPAGSPIRELFKYLSEPGMISFAGGYPASDLFDVDGLDAAAERA